LPLRSRTRPRSGLRHQPPCRGRPRSHRLHPHASQRDDWIAEDKARHFLLSFAVTGYAFAGARAIGVDRDAALPLSILAAGLAGLGKELYDRRRGWGFSVRDLAWDAAGILAAVVVIGEIR
jgi:uncharacterized protein YfiM (DUF2279 family)